MKRSFTGMVLVLLSTKVSYAQYVEYTTRFEVTEINASSPAANTAKSFAAAARMGHVAWVGTPPPAEDSLIQSCVMHTGQSPWPGSCNPYGMVHALYEGQSGSWAEQIFLDSQQQAAFDSQVSHLIGTLKSPNVLPIYGHGDHWVINYSIWKDMDGKVVEFDFYDGGPGGTRDGTNTGYFNGPMMVAPEVWKSVYYKVVTTSPNTDPYYNKYVNLYEPPGGIEPPVARSDYRRSPSPLQTGTRVTLPLVRDLARKSLFDAGLTRHQKEWAILDDSTPMLPFEVFGAYPDGSDWDYYLVPFLNRRHEIVALAMFERETLRFQMATVLERPLPFRGYSHDQARQLAQSSVRSDETLGQGILTWDPVATSEHAYSPLAPYYEFDVYRAGQRIGSTLVHIYSGGVNKLASGQTSRRMR
jgi:hypothetical protein